LPVVIFATLLVAAIVVGRFVVPAGGPQAGAAPPTSRAPSPTVTGGTPTPTLSGLPPLPATPARPADALASWAERVTTTVEIPEVAVQAYGYAQLMVAQSDPQCHLTWTTIAGIGEVESAHGQAGGAVLEPAGRSTPPITGPLLDGKDGRPLVRDTDAGAFDGNATYDRAMGPMRVLPSVWRDQAIDADTDGILDPYDIDDASLAMARLLCSGSEDLGTLSGWTKAVERFHNTSGYARSVFRVADNYGQQTRNIG
jgi:membrane-bound lytic murein transglycosylase B